jgi:hypothetical protein
MENFILISMCLILGILFIWYSQHKESYEKTIAVQGIEAAKKKFRLIKLCGYLLVFGAGVFGIFVIIDIVG